MTVTPEVSKKRARIQVKAAKAAGGPHEFDPGFGPGDLKFTSSSGCGTGSGRSNIWSKSEKIAERINQGRSRRVMSGVGFEIHPRTAIPVTVSRHALANDQ